MKIAIGSDHAGYILKEKIKEHLLAKNYEVLDVGTNDGATSVDYPVYGEAAARLVASDEATYGVVCCGSAIGISIAANKVKGIRCGIAYNDEVARLMREHNCNTGYRIKVMQADCPETGDAMVEAIRAAFGKDVQVDSQIVGPVIGTHCGPGTLGLIFYGDR